MTLIEAIRLERNKNTPNNWLAIDRNGHICSYSKKPSVSGIFSMWRSIGGEYRFVGFHTGPSIPWEKSLIKLSVIRCQ